MLGISSFNIFKHSIKAIKEVYMNGYDFRKVMEEKFIKECPDEPYQKAVEFGQEAVKIITEHKVFMKKQGLSDDQINHLVAIKQAEMLAAKL